MKLKLVIEFKESTSEEGVGVAFPRFGTLEVGKCGEIGCYICLCVIYHSSLSAGANEWDDLVIGAGHPRRGYTYNILSCGVSGEMVYLEGEQNGEPSNIYIQYTHHS